jgi:RHS repeat-associated protein
MHDGVGALTSATLPDTTVLAYDYDGRQRRVAKRRSGSIVKRWVYEGQYRVVAEVDGSGSVVSRFVYASQSHSPDYMVRAGVTYVFVKNQLGSIRLVVDSVTGTVSQRLDYDAWGKISQDSNPGFQPFGFAGGIYDKDTGLTHFGFRDYDANSGVWSSKDPLRLGGGLGMYSYVGNQTIAECDPTGLWSPSAHDEIIRHALANRIPAKEIRRLQESSREFDKNTQGPDQSHMHSMARIGQTPADAASARDAFVNERIAAACAENKKGNRNRALEILAEALHPLMDQDSPLHHTPDGLPATWDPHKPWGLFRLGLIAAT